MEGSIFLYVGLHAPTQRQTQPTQNERTLTTPPTGFYHSDRPLTQQALARSLSYSLVPTLPCSTVHRFLRAFWITIGREFHSIDRLRLDKYMFLIRCYVGVAFEIFIRGKQQQQQQQRNQQDGAGKKRKREEEAASAEAAKDAKGKNGKKQNKKSKEKKQNGENEISTQNTTNGNESNTTPPKLEQETEWSDLETYITILEEGPLNPLNFDPDQPTSIDEKTDYVPMPHGPDGLRYHVMDLWLDELEKVLEFENYEHDTAEKGEGEGEGEGHRPRKLVSDVPMDLLLRPMEKLRAEGVHKPVRTRALENLQDERLFEWGVKERKAKKSEEDEDEESEEEWGGFGDD